MAVSLEVLGVGSAPDDETGDTARDGGLKIKNNFAALETQVNANETAIAGKDAWGDPVDANIVPAAAATYTLGTSAASFASLYANNVRAQDSSALLLSVDTKTADTATSDIRVYGQDARAIATTNLDGGDVDIKAGAGSSLSAGDADGGFVYLNGGRGYGTGTHGNVVVGNNYGNLQVDGKTILGDELAAGGNNITDLGDVTFKTGAAGGTLRTGTSNADKFQLQAYDVDGGAYVTLIEADAGNDVRLQIPVNYLDLEDATDTTKIARLDSSGITTGTTRTYSFPDASGTLALTSDLTKYTGQNLQTGTTYTLVLSDAGKIVEMNNASANTLTIPANASVAFPVDTRIDVVQYGAGQTTIAITSDTLRGDPKTGGQYQAVSLWKRAATEWVVIGGIA